MIRLGIVVAVLAGAFGCQTVGAGTKAPSPVESSLPRLAEAALPAVVLIVATRPNGDTTYGAGLLVGQPARVLTNLHVVEPASALRVMLYRADRPSYTPMDGGLGRYLFENAKELIPARLVKRDATVDLALLQVDGDTSGHPRLPFAAEPVHIGDRVLALGHPGESVWSFTSGVVSALPQGTIQHDAAVSPGSSGGPLINTRGAVVGINTAKALSGTEGVAFARPVSIARRLFEALPGDVDLSDLERAVLGCFHEQELASPGMVDCFEYRDRYAMLVAGVHRVSNELGLDASAARTLEQAFTRGGYDAYVDREKRKWRKMEGAGATTTAVSAVCGGSGSEPECSSPSALHSVYAQAPLGRVRTLLQGAKDDLEQADLATRHLLTDDAGFKADLRNPKAIQATLKMGIRIEAIRHRNDRAAWVLLAGRNVDGSPYHLTELWKRRGDTWHQQIPVLDAELRDEPPGWPRPLGMESLSLAGARVYVLSVIEARCCVPGYDGPGSPPPAKGKAPAVRAWKPPQVGAAPKPGHT